MTKDQVRKVIGYARVSREEQVRSGLGLDAQCSAIRQACAAKGWELVGIVQDKGVSGSIPWDQRPGLRRAVAFLSSSEAPAASKSALPELGAPDNSSETSSKKPHFGMDSGKLVASWEERHDMSEMDLALAGEKLARIENPRVDPVQSARAQATTRGWRGQSIRTFKNSGLPSRRGADALVVAKLDRISRSVFDFSAMVRLAEERGFALVVLDPDLDFTSASGRLMANVLASFAEFERDLIRQRTREALQAARRRGTVLGRPVEVSADDAGTMLSLHRDGASLRLIAEQLNRLGGTAPGGKAWTHQTVGKVLKRLERT